MTHSEGRDPGTDASWDAELPPGQFDPHPELELKLVGVRCKGCGGGYRVSVMPWSPRVGKSECGRCGHVNEVVTRDEAMASIEEMFHHNHDVAKVTASPKAFSKDLGRKKKRRR